MEKDGELHATCVPWNRIICDTINSEGNPIIEKLELTPAQLKRSNYDKEQVKALIEARDSRETLDGQKRDNKSDYITLYEIHGELPLSYLTGKEKDEETYVQQMHVLSYVEGKTTRGDIDYQDFSLYKGKEKDPYLMTHLIKEDGRTQAIGAVEHLFDAQWMTNHSVKLIKDQLDLASQLIFQTSDGSFVGKNVLQSILTGDILVHAEGQPLTALANTSHDITALQNFSTQWQALAKDITSTPDAIRGNNQVSGTAFRTVAIENKEANSLFEVMTRNKKRQLEEMFRRFVIPHIKKKMDTSEEIAATLESQDITKLDMMYVPNEAIRRDNRQIIDTVLSGQIAQNMDRKMMEQQIQDELAQDGNQRFLNPSTDIPDKTWKQALEGLEWDVEVDIKDKEAADQEMAMTLIDLFKTVSNPAVQQFITTPQGKLLYNKTLEKTNAISPIEIASTPIQPSQMAAPQTAFEQTTKQLAQ